jgi:hypothetical protein
MRPAALLNINVMHARYYQNNVLNYFFFINVGVQNSLHASRLILQTLKLTTM